MKKKLKGCDMDTELRIGFEATDVQQWMIDGIKAKSGWNDSLNIPENVFDFLYEYFARSEDVEESIGADDLERLFYRSYEEDEASRHGMSYWREWHGTDEMMAIFNSFMRFRIHDKFASRPAKQDDPQVVQLFDHVDWFLKNELFEHWTRNVFRDQECFDEWCENCLEVYQENFFDDWDEHMEEIYGE